MDTELTNKESEVEFTLEDLRLSPKHELFVRYYIDPSNKDTYGNATQSAIKAYNLDPVKQYNYARIQGHKLATKYNDVGRAYLESKGLTFIKMIDIAAMRVATTNNAKWWDIVATIGDYKKDEKPLVEVHNNTQINNYDIHGSEVKNANSKFKEWLESQ